MFWLCLQFSLECFVMSHLLSTGWWIHSMFNDSKPHIRLSWHNKIAAQPHFSESDCHTLKGEHKLENGQIFKNSFCKLDRQSGRQVPQVAEEKLKLSTGPAAGKQFVTYLVPTFCIWLMSAVLALSPHLSIFHVLFIFLHYKLWYKMFQTG